jgi:hypothetical protein
MVAHTINRMQVEGNMDRWYRLVRTPATCSMTLEVRKSHIQNLLFLRCGLSKLSTTIQVSCCSWQTTGHKGFTLTELNHREYEPAKRALYEQLPNGQYLWMTRKYLLRDLGDPGPDPMDKRCMRLGRHRCCTDWRRVTKWRQIKSQKPQLI